MEGTEIRVMDRADLMNRIRDFQQFTFPYARISFKKLERCETSPCADRKKGERMSKT